MAKKEETKLAIPDFEEVVKGFESYQQNTEQEFAHLPEGRMAYNDEGELVLVVKNSDYEDVTYWFPETNQWPLKQLLKRLGVPYSFFAKCSRDLQDRICAEFLRKVADKDGDEEHAGDVILKYRETDGRRTLRAVVPYTHVTLRNTDVLDSINTLRTDKWEMIAAEGIRQDEERTFLRFVTGVKVAIDGIELEHGFDVTFSELEGCKLTLQPILHNRETGVTTVATKTMSAWFTRDYDGVGADEFQVALENLLETQDTKSHMVADVVKDGVEESWADSEARRKDVLLELDGLKDFKGVTKAALKTLAAELENLPTRWQLAMYLAQMAANMPGFDKRQRHEAAAGYLLGLDLTYLWDDGNTE